MATVLVTYDLHDDTKSDEVLEYIRAGGYARLAESTYALSTDSTPSTIVDALMKLTNNKITCFACYLNTSVWAGFGSDQAVYSWLNGRAAA